jgi:predicted secreted protein
MKSRLSAIAASTVLAASAAAAQPEPQPFNQVELQAEVSREVPNDLMTATLYAEVTDAAAAQVASRLNKLTADALKIAGESKAVKVRSGASSTFPVYDRSGKLTGWRGRSEIRLESPDVQATAALIGKLQATMQLGNVAFSVSPALRRQTENEMIAEAVGAFRARAEIAVKALGGKSYKIRRVAINTGGSVPVPRPMAAQRAMAMADVTPPAFESGTSTVLVSANGTVQVE